MDAESAKTERTKAKRLLTMAITSMDKAINRSQMAKIVQDKFATVNRCWLDVADKHAMYIAMAYPEEKDVPDTETEWIEKAEDDYDSAIVRCDDYIQENKEIKVATITIPHEDIKKKGNILKYEVTSLKTIIATVESLVNDKNTNQDAIEGAKLALQTQQEKCDTAQREHIASLVDDKEVEEALKQAEKIKSDCMKALIAVSKVMEQKTSQKTAEMGKKFMELKLERMKMPRFSGNIREYPRFKTDFTRYVMPSVKDSDSAAYILKSCLSGSPLDAVKNVDDDVKNMWKRLDEKYGRTSKLTDAILLDIKQLKAVQEGENQKFIDFVDKVEACYKDLSIIGKESEISNSSIVGMIEEKLPTSIRKQWCLQIINEDVDMDGEDKFYAILSFLLTHKKATEYDTSELRSPKPGASNKMNHISSGSGDEKDIDAVNVVSKTDKKPCWLHGRNSKHSIFDCQVFIAKTPEERVALASRHRVCWCCLDAGHTKGRCYNKTICGIDGCTKFHHQALHTSDGNNNNGQVMTPPNPLAQPAAALPVPLQVPDGDDIQQNHVSNQERGQQHCLLQLMKIKAGNPNLSVNVLWDSGATISMITFKKAKQLGISGSPAQISIVKVGGKKETINSKVFQIPLYDSENNIEIFKAYGIEKISSSIQCTNVNDFSKILKIDNDKIRRPTTGEIDMLIGYEYAGFHPQKIRSENHLLLLKNKFGYCVGGSQVTLEEKTNLLIQAAEVCHADVKLDDFYEAESLGITCNPRCGSCKCGECAIGGKQYTIQEERELAVIENGLSLHDNKWIAKYPWKRDPRELPNNYPVALAVLRSTERRLLKDNEKAKLYDDQIQDMLVRGVARKLSKEEERNYRGPVHYVSHHEVMKPESQSTPCRIVFNSSASYMGHTLNEYWFKGPDLLNDLLGILLRFRENHVAFAGDVKKMYHTIGISELDQHTHRFLWRNLQVEKQPDTHIITAVSFGDRPAGAIASLALQKTAQMGEAQYPQASFMIKKNTYMDDIVGSLDSNEDVKRITTNIEEILKKGSFEIKEWITSYSSAIVPLDNRHDISSKILGVVWDTQKDELRFQVRLNFSEKKRKIREGVDITLKSIEKDFPTILTRRMILSQVNGIYDPLGLATPYLVQAKLLLRELTVAKSGWDDSIPEIQRQEWLDFFRKMFSLDNISFNRSIKPDSAHGKPSLVLFSDASKQAFGACAYIRWMISNDEFECKLLMAKSKLAPRKELSMPRLELNGALLSARIRQFIEKEVNIEFSAIYHIVDSEIVRAMIQKESYGFNTFVATRVGEIQNLTSKEDWYWVESNDNVSDIITRGANPEEIGQGSIWQDGPAFIKKPVKQWPVKQSFSGTVLPELTKSAQINIVEKKMPMISDFIDSHRFSSYNKLIRVTARVLSVPKDKPSLKNVGQILKRKNLQEAERMWIIASQADLSTQIKPETLKRLSTNNDNGVIRVGTRLESWQNLTYDGQPPVLLSAKSQLAKLYTSMIHNACHLGVASVMTKVRRRFWIVGLRQLVRSIRFKCVKCKRLNGKTIEQVMGKIPTERLQPAPAWSYTSVDFFGPYEIKGETNKRSRSKGYGVLFNCLLSRAVYIDIVPDYSTDSFLLALRRFLALNGCPIKMWSDRGSQIMAADKELKQAIVNLDEKVISEFSSANSFDWKFSAPEAPWQNGCAEALVKSVKKAIKTSIGTQALTFSEMTTVFYEAAQLVNERPIGRHPTSTEDGVYLAPNDLLLGRSSRNIPYNDYLATSNLAVRYHFVQQIVSAFWKRWTVNFFPSLLIQQKWHTSCRNVMVGDIVLIQDSKLKKGEWRMGRVAKADASLRDGYVRNIEIQYKNPNSSSFVTITRPVQRIIVLVPIEEAELEPVKEADGQSE